MQQINLAPVKDIANEQDGILADVHGTCTNNPKNVEVLILNPHSVSCTFLEDSIRSLFPCKTWEILEDFYLPSLIFWKEISVMK